MPVLINGTDLATLVDLIDTTWEGDLTPAVGAPPTRPTNADFGERATGAPAVVGPRTVRVEGMLQAATATALETAKDLLFAACSGHATGPTANAVTVALVPDGGGNGRQWTGYLTGQSALTRIDGLTPLARVTLVFTCPDPRAADASLSTYTLDATVGHAALGTVTVRPLLQLAGAFSSRVVTYVDGAGVTRGTLTVTGTVASGETLEVDCDAQSVVLVSALGVRTPKNAWLTAGDFFALDPAHVVTGINPGIKLDAGAGFFMFHRRWR